MIDMAGKSEEELEKALKNVHAGHRQRMRKRFLQTGELDGFEDHEALEMLLFCAIPRRNTNPMAHHLLLKFGSLDRVFDASPEELQTVPGIGPKASKLIGTIPDLAQELEELSHLPRQFVRLKTEREVSQFMATRFPDLAAGTLYIILLNQEYQLMVALPFKRMAKAYFLDSLRKFDIFRAARICCVEAVDTDEDEPELATSWAFPILFDTLNAFRFSSWDYYLSNNDRRLTHEYDSLRGFLY